MRENTANARLSADGLEEELSRWAPFAITGGSAPQGATRLPEASGPCRDARAVLTEGQRRRGGALAGKTRSTAILRPGVRLTLAPPCVSYDCLKRAPLADHRRAVGGGRQEWG
jgi:hypothetical protein